MNRRNPTYRTQIAKLRESLRRGHVISRSNSAIVNDCSRRGPLNFLCVVHCRNERGCGRRVNEVSATWCQRLVNVRCGSHDIQVVIGITKLAAALLESNHVCETCREKTN